MPVMSHSLNPWPNASKVVQGGHPKRLGRRSPPRVDGQQQVLHLYQCWYFWILDSLSSQECGLVWSSWGHGVIEVLGGDHSVL